MKVTWYKDSNPIRVTAKFGKTVSPDFTYCEVEYLDYDPDKSHNGGSYYQPTIKLVGKDISLVIEDTSCGDFGNRIDIQMNINGNEYHLNYDEVGVNDGDGYHLYSNIPYVYRKKIYESPYIFEKIYESSNILDNMHLPKCYYDLFPEIEKKIQDQVKKQMK